MTLPTFLCYPDPLAAGSIEAAGTVCACCGQARGYVYVGASYGEDDYVDCICPWCIADGSAHARLKVEFTDPGAVGGYGKWCTRCGDAALFLGGLGYQELVQPGKPAIAAIHKTAEDYGDSWDVYLQALRKNGSPTAYLFQCLHCGKYRGYSDND